MGKKCSTLTIVKFSPIEAVGSLQPKFSGLWRVRPITFFSIHGDNDDGGFPYIQRANKFSDSDFQSKN